RVDAWGIADQADRERLLLADPARDVAVGDPLAREEIAEEFPVVGLGGPGRHLVGNLPSECHQGPLPRGDVMILGVGDHSIEIEQDGAWSHEKDATGSETSSWINVDYVACPAARQIIDTLHPGP